MLAISEMSCRTVLRKTGLFERVGTTSCFAVGKCKWEPLVSAELCMHGNEKQGSVEKGRKSVVLSVTGKGVGGVEKQRGRGAGSEWRVDGTVCFGCASCR